MQRFVSHYCTLLNGSETIPILGFDGIQQVVESRLLWAKIRYEYIGIRPFPLGDVSGDWSVSAYDAALILQYVVGLIDSFPAESPVGQVAQKFIGGEITIEELNRTLQQLGYPSVFGTQLLQNYPNPFNPETWIPFQLAQNTPVTISIYDAKGQKIKTIALGNRNAGIYTTKAKAAYWDGRDSLGEKVSSGYSDFCLLYQSSRS